MQDSMQVQVREEVEGLHRFFVGWFSGQIDESAFRSDFQPRIAPDVVFIPPAGMLLGWEDLSSMIQAGYGSNPDFRIQIRNVRVRREFDGHVLATYEEWQRNALASDPPDNGRIATVLFSVGQRLLWQHIHETWLPADAIAAGPYDF